MGRSAKQTEFWVEPVELGKRIPADHLLRKIGKILDLRFVHREVSGFYGRNGHVSADPVVIMMLMLLLFLDDEGQELSTLVDANEQNTARRARVVVADCRYGNTANFIALAKRGVRTHMGDLRSRLRNARAEGIYPASDFPYDKRADTFLCPAKK